MSSLPSTSTSATDNQELDDVLDELENFVPGSSVYGPTPSTKRQREGNNEKKSPTDSSPPQKAVKDSEGPRYRTRKGNTTPLPPKKLAKPKKQLVQSSKKDQVGQGTDTAKQPGEKNDSKSQTDPPEAETQTQSTSSSQAAQTVTDPIVLGPSNPPQSLNPTGITSYSVSSEMSLYTGCLWDGKEL